MNQVSGFLAHWTGDPPKVIFEAGARDCTETLEFHRIFPDAQIWAFECNPETLPLCREKVAGIAQIHLVEKAVYNRPGIIPFYQIDTERTITAHSDGNPGASSLFIASGKYPAETLVQNEIQVEAVTFAQIIEANNLPGVDVLWLDMQGGELAALEGLGDYITTVKLLMTEVEFKAIYAGQPLEDDIDAFLVRSGFTHVTFVDRCEWFANSIYRRAA